MTNNRGTISFGPPFGYELCARRIRLEETEQFDLSSWRVAGVGAEPIRSDVLEAFVKKLAPFGFDHRAFVASYGMAECSLAVSFAQINQGAIVEEIDAEHLSNRHEALPVADISAHELEGRRTKKLVNCGVPLPGNKIVIRDNQGQTLPDRKCGTIYVCGPSVMKGYFGDPVATAKVLSDDGWLNTGDIGYLNNGSLVVTGREKDMIIINGRNIWPQDLEFHAEQQPEVRPGDASAISVPAKDGSETAVMVVQCRETDENKRKELSNRLASVVREELGIDCTIELVSAHTLPRTSSGKLSRAGTQRDYMRRQEEQNRLEVKVLFEELAMSDDRSDLRLAADGQRHAL